MRLSILATAAVLTLAPTLGVTAQAASLDTAAQSATATQIATANTMMLVSHGYAHLRKEPNTKSAILATLKKGAKLEVLGTVASGKWAHVKSGKLDGYVAVSLLKAQ